MYVFGLNVNYHYCLSFYKITLYVCGPSIITVVDIHREINPHVVADTQHCVIVRLCTIMAILYAVIARGTTVLAQHAGCAGNFIEVTEQVLAKISPSNNKLTYSHGRLVFSAIVCFLELSADGS